MKKTEPVTYRTDKKTKEVLQQIAAEKKWSISQLSEEIIKEWLREKYPDMMEKEQQNWGCCKTLGQPLNCFYRWVILRWYSMPYSNILRPTSRL